MLYKVKLRIADIIIKIQSNFALEQLTEKEKKVQITGRFNNFFYKGKAKPDIIVKVDIVDKLPKIKKKKDIFVTFHFQDGSENWRLFKRGSAYVYKCPLEDRKQLVLINKTFDRVTVYLLPKKEKGYVWNVADIIYDFLQVLLINYFAQRNEGIFTHAIGVKDLDRKGLLFAGKSGAGKSTTARLWHKHSKAIVLNDDRIIVRKFNGKFLIYGSPWHGEFSDYLDSRIESAPLKKLFFIHHSSKNIARQVSEKKAFSLLYPALFPTFWDKECLENIVSFCQDLVKDVPCYSLGFVNGNKVIEFVRSLT